MNWVLIIVGLLPLWAALFIIFTNMRVLKDDQPLNETAPVQLEQPVRLELTANQVTEREEPKSFFKGLLGRFKGEKTDEPRIETEIDFSEPNSDAENGSLGFPKSIRRIWGVTFVLIFIACLVFGLDRALAYIFKAYRWEIGTPNPWTSQLEFASVSTSAIAGIATMVSTLKTGVYLLKR